jgi:hypothetical protein
MNFVVVNHDPPSGASACDACSRVLQPGYLREMRTPRRYCGHNCYHQHQLTTNLMPWSFSGLTAVGISKGYLPDYGHAVEIVTLFGAIATWRYTTQMWALSRTLAEAFLSAHERIATKGGDT